MGRHGVRPQAVPSLAVMVVFCAVVGLHRFVLWRLFGQRIDAVAAANPDWLTWQYLNLPAYVEHFAPALWYLQQTPPLPHLVFGVLAKIAAWPIGVARGLYGIQAVISGATAGVLFLLLRRLRCGGIVGLAACLWFALSSDLYVTEINSLGQLIYESGAMLFAVGACYCLVEAYQRRSERLGATLWFVLGAGVLVAFCALTRASFSLFFVPTVGFAGACLGPRRTAIMVLPILLLQGGWSLKNAAVYGYLSPNTSSWAGINATVSMDDALQAEFVQSIESGTSGAAPWVVKLLKQQGYVSWSPPIPADLLPAEVASQQQHIQDVMGGTNNPENSVGVQRLSSEYLHVLKPFALHHLDALWAKFRSGYAIFWQPIANYSAMFVGPLSTLPEDPGAWPKPAFALVRPAQAMAGTFPDVSHTPVVLPALSLDVVDVICFWSLHVLLPLLLLHDGIMLALRRRGLVTAEMVLLALVIGYGSVLFNAVELGENMRFRLSIEPEIIALSAATLAAAASLVRRAAAHLRPAGLGPSIPRPHDAA